MYTLFEEYCRLKPLMRRYDTCDLVYSIYRQLSAPAPSASDPANPADGAAAAGAAGAVGGGGGGGGGFKGVAIHSIMRDEVQDFTQAEMLLDLHVLQDPAGAFYCGDTAQTIARGVAFRRAGGESHRYASLLCVARALS